jgi:lysophospholipase L1-like esterase
MTAVSRRRPPARVLVLLVAFGVGLAGVVAELSLRAFGFKFRTFPVVQFGWPEPHEIRDVYMPDRELFWVTQDYAAKLADARRSRPAVVFMGDSCTEFGAWPQLTLERLAMRDPSLARGVSLAVGGWSSEQGLRQLRRDVLPLHPRVVTIYYGWNDHWLAFGEPDGDVHANAISYWLAEHLRLVQLVVKARLGAGANPSAAASFRVPLDRYRMNIEALGRLARAAGIRAVFITAPTSHERGREPEYLALRHLRDLNELVPLHASYVQATREAAMAAGAEMCDAAAMFAALPGPTGQYFNRDGIHFSDSGSRALADMLANCVAPDRTATSATVRESSLATDGHAVSAALVAPPWHTPPAKSPPRL